MGFKKLKKDNPKRMVVIGRLDEWHSYYGFPTTDIAYVSVEWKIDPITKQPYVEISARYNNDNPDWYHKP